MSAQEWLYYRKNKINMTQYKLYAYTRQCMTIYSLYYLQAISHKGPQVRPIGIDSLQKTELRENMGKVTFIHGNVEASKQFDKVQL